MSARTAPPIARRGRRTSVAGVPILHWAAGLGAVLLAFELFILAKWVLGPDFERVPKGASDMPGWMSAGLVIGQVVLTAATVFMFWRLLIRPWIRERTVTLYGLLCPALILTSVYDPLGSYFSNWYGYNSGFLSWGSPLPGGIPGWQSYAEPGAMIAWPPFFICTAYVVVFIGNTWFGGKVIGAVQRRYPRTPPLAILACVLTIVTIDLIIEGTVMMRLGWYAETGASVMGEGEYYQLPWRNLIFAALMWTGFATFGYYRNDAGQTFVERGAERFATSSLKGAGLRFLAVLAASQIILIGLYQVPMGLHQKAFPAEWPEAISSKTYFNNGVCGYGTPRECP